VQGDSTNPESLTRIKQAHFTEGASLIVYLAVPPSIFGKICTSLETAGLSGENTRIVVEKPLGNSRETFLAIDREFRRVFNENQIFRIDHYLGKESVQNLLALRFANDIFEPIWTHRLIDHIQITVSETVGCGNRWDFYEETGAIRDMVQNHLLQVLCLVCMEPPATLDAESVRTEKLKILKCLKPIDASNVKESMVRGQYRAGVVGVEKVPGYLEEDESLGRPSDVETYIALKVEIENFRWSGTPIYLRTGKRLDKRLGEIVINFKQNHSRLFKDQLTENCANQLVIYLQPDEGIRVRLKNKKAGLDARVPLIDRTLDLSFCETAKAKRHDAYSRLLFDVIRNDQTLFVSEPEVEAAWKWVDTMRAAWMSEEHKTVGYEAGSDGPKESDEFMARDGRCWHKGRY
jgi:glucose-6-phosphate 1-dehydrogenase